MVFGLDDSLAAVFGAETALIIITLAAIDYIQLKYLEKRLDPVSQRLQRLENQHMLPDGGKIDDNKDD